MVEINYRRTNGGETVNIVSDEKPTNDLLLTGLFGENACPPAPPQPETLESEQVRISLPALKEIMKQCKDGKKIGAIKEIRAAFGWGLKEAKFFVDEVFPPQPANW